MTILRRPAVACVALLLVYVALSFANDHRGYLGTDTGGKVATLRVMEVRGTVDPDIGYWAEPWDPDGVLHPLYYTYRFGDRWVNVTTLPALIIAQPLFDLGGYRLALLLPMLGSAFAALAALVLARRLGGDGWAAFWIVGLASPLAIYALDFWEHSIGVALVAWGVVLLLRPPDEPWRWWRSVAAGACFGTAATMRTEALVFGAVATAVVCVVSMARRPSIRPALTGAGVIAGLVVPLLLNVALEQAIIDDGLRAERAVGTVKGAATGGTAGASRAEEAALTFLGLTPRLDAQTYLVGAGVLLLLAWIALRTGRDDTRDRGPAVLALAAVIVLYVLSLSDGPSFVPGLVAATPLAAFGLARGARRREGPGSGAGQEHLLRGQLLVIAVAALPIVWATQFTGGAAPQWAGRYILASGLLLGVLGVVALGDLVRWARIGAIVLAGGITAFGLTWLSVRSHDVARASAALNRRPEPVLVSRVGHLVREGGWFYGDKRWLTAESAEEERRAAEVVAEAGFDEFAVVELEEAAASHDHPGWQRTGTSSLRLFSGVPLRITTLERTR